MSKVSASIMKMIVWAAIAEQSSPEFSDMVVKEVYALAASDNLKGSPNVELNKVLHDVEEEEPMVNKLVDFIGLLDPENDDMYQIDIDGDVGSYTPEEYLEVIYKAPKEEEAAE